MAKTKVLPGDAKALATLDLARSIVEGDADAARAALNAGADPDAFWIDGRRSLRELALEGREGRSSDGVERLFLPEALKKLPPRKEDRSRWSREFVEFAAMRGYEFSGRTSPLSGMGGRDLTGLSTAKAGVDLIGGKWLLLEDAACQDIEGGRKSQWHLTFGADWKGDRRIVGFWLKFTVDASGWELATMFDELGKSGKRVGWPDLADPLTCGQKDWEGALVARDLLSNKYGIDLLIKSLRKGASPFAEIGWEEKLIGEDGYGDSESKAFLEELREALGPREGWHCRIAPLLTNEGVAALREKAALKLSTPKAKAPKKKLKNRSDIL